MKYIFVLCCIMTYNFVFIVALFVLFSQRLLFFSDIKLSEKTPVVSRLKNKRIHVGEGRVGWIS